MIGDSPKPIVIVDIITNTVAAANESARRSLAIEVEHLLSEYIPNYTGSIDALNGKVVKLARSHYLAIIYRYHDGTRPYAMIMLQQWDAEHSLSVRNRALSITLTAILLLFSIVLIVRLSRRLKLISREQHDLQFSLSLLQSFFDTDPRMVSIRDEGGTFVYANEAFYAHFGLAPHSIIGTSVNTFPDAKVAKEAGLSDALIIESQQPVEELKEYHGRLMNIYKFPLQLPDHRMGVGTLVRDVTEERQVEEVLRENLRRSALLTEMLSIAHRDDSDHQSEGLGLSCTLTSSESALLLSYKAHEGVLVITALCNLTIPLTEISKSSSAAVLSLLVDGKSYIENHNPHTHPLATVMGASVHCLLTVPFYSEERLQGIVLLANRTGGYTDQDGYQVQVLFSALHTASQKARRDRQLQQSRQRLRLILDSTAEGIFGVNTEGLCTFANASALALLGYDEEQELLGKNIHALIHSKDQEGNPITALECPLHEAITTAKGVEMEGGVFWRKDGTYFAVLAHSYPQIRDGQVTGAVVTFTDNTERKRNLERIEYLSLHDQLTGLYNRTYFDQALAQAQQASIVPYSIIVGDVNGLKLTNDVFGHNAGDGLLIEVSRTLRESCPQSASVSRIGGDEFVILLPSTSQEEVAIIMSRVRDALDKRPILSGQQAIALGSATRTSLDTSIHEVYDSAEDQMYQEKMLRLRQTQSHQLEQLIAQLFKKAPKEEQHARAVRHHALMIGTLLGLESEMLSLLGRAAYYHDIGKLVLEAPLIATKGAKASQRRLYQTHVSAGYRILNTFEETMDLAPYVLHHHEWYNGGGYLKGLKGEEIPSLSRILRLAEIWEREGLSKKNTDQVIAILGAVSGVEADPAMVQILVEALRSGEADKARSPIG